MNMPGRRGVHSVGYYMNCGWETCDCVCVCAHVRVCMRLAWCLPITLLHFVSALQRITEKDQNTKTCWSINLWRNMRLQMWMWPNGTQEPRSTVRLTCHAVHQLEGKACRIGRNSGYRSCILLSHHCCLYTYNGSVVIFWHCFLFVSCFIQAFGWKHPYCSLFPVFHWWSVAGYHISLMSPCTCWTFLFSLSPGAFF